MAALNIHIIHAPALNLAPAVSPFSSWPLVATIVRWRFIPKSEVYPIAGAVAMHAMLWLALAHIGCTERNWGAGVPCLGAEFGFVGAVSAAGGADVALPCILHLYNPGSYITPFWGPHYVRHRQLDQPFYFVLCTQAPFHDLDFEVE